MALQESAINVVQRRPQVLGRGPVQPAGHADHVSLPPSIRYKCVHTMHLADDFVCLFH